MSLPCSGFLALSSALYESSSEMFASLGHAVFMRNYEVQQKNPPE